MKLSLAIITGNVGAATMRRFLSHFEPFVDEIVIVRAIGGQPPDDTLDEAAKSAKVRLAEYRNAPEYADWPHVDDFAAARNMAWRMAAGEWIMWADTDDIVAPEHLQRLRSLIEHNDELDIILCPYIVPAGGMEKNIRERAVRRGKAHWVQRVHECLEATDKTAKLRAHTDETIQIIHAPGDAPKGRGGRNLRIIESLPPEEMNTSLRYHRFAELGVLGRVQEAERAAIEFLQDPEAGKAERFHVMMGMATLDADPAARAGWLNSAWQECPERREPLVNLATLAMSAGNHARAQAYLDAAGGLPEPAEKPWNHVSRVYGWHFVAEQARCLRLARNFAKADAIQLNHFIRSGARISLLHATRGRPMEAAAARMLWMERAAEPDAVEHIFACDPDDPHGPSLGGFRHIVQDEGGGPVGAWNMAASIARGEVLVQVSDDMIPPMHWDRAILAAIGDTSEPRVLRVSDGHRTDGLIVLAIVTREWVRRTGYLFHPAFFSMFSDSWLTEQAQAAGAIIEAPHLLFEHRHPFFTGEPMHATTAESNRLLHYATGAAVLRQLRAGQPVFTWRQVPGLSAVDGPAVCHEQVVGRMRARGHRSDIRCAEVGVAQGRSACALGTLLEFTGKPWHVLAVDTFAGTAGEAVEYPADMRERFLAHRNACGFHDWIFPCAMDSLTAAERQPAEAFDYVFLDAGHDYESVRADLAAWAPKVARGGYFAGHDYTHSAEVKRAVDEAFGERVQVVGECWLVEL